MHKIKRVSLFFRVLFQICFVSIIPLQLFIWANAPSLHLTNGISFDAFPKAYQTIIPATLSLQTKILGFLVSSLPNIVELFILYSLIQLFRLYEKGEIFSLNNVRYIRNVGYAFLLEQLVDPISQFLLGFVLSSYQPPGHRVAIVSLSGTNVGIILIAFIIILISWIMVEGCHLREEQQLTI